MYVIHCNPIFSYIQNFPSKSCIYINVNIIIYLQYVLSSYVNMNFARKYRHACTIVRMYFKHTPLGFNLLWLVLIQQAISSLLGEPYVLAIAGLINLKTFRKLWKFRGIGYFPPRLHYLKPKIASKNGPGPTRKFIFEGLR